MKITQLIIVLSFLMLFSCKNEVNKIKELRIEFTKAQNEVKKLNREKQITFLALKNNPNSIFDSPLKRFFDTPEFWETFIGVDPIITPPLTQCEKNCLKKFEVDIETCQSIEDGQTKVICFWKIREDKSDCFSRCFGTNNHSYNKTAHP